MTFSPGDYKNGEGCSEFYMIGTTLNYNIVKVKKCIIFYIYIHIEREYKVFFNLRNE